MENFEYKEPKVYSKEDVKLEHIIDKPNEVVIASKSVNNRLVKLMAVMQLSRKNPFFKVVIGSTNITHLSYNIINALDAYNAIFDKDQEVRQLAAL